MARLPGKIKAGGTGQPTKEGRDAQRPDFPGWYARDDIPDAGYDNDLATVKAVRDNGGGGGGAVDSVNGQTGDVVLDADDVGALESGDNISLLTNDAGYLATVASDSSLTGNGTAGSPLSVVGGGGAVDSVNGQTGVVVLDADDVGALATVATDATLTGDGTVGDPLSVVGSGSSLTVTDGTTTVNNVDEIQFTKANSVTDLTGGVVEVNNDGGGSGGTPGASATGFLNTFYGVTRAVNSAIYLSDTFEDNGSGITLSGTSATGTQITIPQGFKGLLHGSAVVNWASAPTAGRIDYRWYDVTNSTFKGKLARNFCTQNTSLSQSSSPLASVNVDTTSGPVVFELRYVAIQSPVDFEVEGTGFSFISTGSGGGSKCMFYWDGASTVITNSVGIASVTRLQQGEYRVTLSSAMPSAYFPALASADPSGSTTNYACGTRPDGASTNSFLVRYEQSNGVGFDPATGSRVSVYVPP